VAAALDVVGPDRRADRAPEHLSLGERRRVALAGVLAAQPEVLVLDEPTANLDPAARRDLIEVIRGLDLTTLVITHDLPLALELCPRAVVLAHGRVAVDGPTQRSFANPSLLAAHRAGAALPHGGAGRLTPGLDTGRSGATPWTRVRHAPPRSPGGRPGRRVVWNGQSSVRCRRERPRRRGRRRPPARRLPRPSRPAARVSPGAREVSVRYIPQVAVASG
jgi:hypothetical protein